MDGDNLSFAITVKFQDNGIKLNYKGKVSGDQVKFSVQSDRGTNLEYVAKRVS